MLAAAAGFTDLRWRRIPNWLTVPGWLLGMTMHSIDAGWRGTRESLLGSGLGLLVLLPFVLVRSLGAGDWKLVGAIGAFLGPERLMTVLFITILIAGIMAVILVLWKRQLGQTLSNIGRMLAALASLHLPGRELSLDNPKALKIPFGFAASIAVILYAAGKIWQAG
ncbi:MAG TPA: A24 family peptidase [Terriglobales bacterium]|nr:A24 family peptidase [Terriglobales bacterium]